MSEAKLPLFEAAVVLPRPASAVAVAIRFWSFRCASHSSCCSMDSSARVTQGQDVTAPLSLVAGSRSGGAIVDDVDDGFWFDGVPLEDDTIEVGLFERASAGANYVPREGSVGPESD